MTIVDEETQEVPAEETPSGVETAPSAEEPATEEPATDLECAHDDKCVTISGDAKSSADWSRNRRSSIGRIMKKQKEEDEVPLGENIYSLFIVSPTMSWPFLFCIGVYAIKVSILAILLSDIDLGDLLEEEVKVTIVKFCLIPVAVAMQEDMMYSFYFYANVKYDPGVLEFSPVATKERFYFSYFLRTVDGILSLFSNYFIMLITPVTLDVFLNFAALQFLYAIDDIFFELVSQGFFGDVLEGYSIICKTISMKRRAGKDNSKVLGFIRISWLDTILFIVSLLFCYIIFGIVTASKYIEDFNAIIGTAAPTVSPMPSYSPSAMPSDLPSMAPFLLSGMTDDGS